MTLWVKHLNNQFLVKSNGIWNGNYCVFLIWPDHHKPFCELQLHTLIFKFPWEQQLLNFSNFSLNISSCFFFMSDTSEQLNWFFWNSALMLDSKLVKHEKKEKYTSGMKQSFILQFYHWSIMNWSLAKFLNATSDGTVKSYSCLFCSFFQYE